MRLLRGSLLLLSAEITSLLGVLDRLLLLRDSLSVSLYSKIFGSGVSTAFSELKNGNLLAFFVFLIDLSGMDYYFSINPLNKLVGLRII